MSRPRSPHQPTRRQARVRVKPLRLAPSPIRARMAPGRSRSTGATARPIPSSTPAAREVCLPNPIPMPPTAASPSPSPSTTVWAAITLLSTSRSATSRPWSPRQLTRRPSKARAKSFALGSFTDPGADGPWQVTVNWGDGTSHTVFNANSAGSLPPKSHTLRRLASSPPPSRSTTV